MARVSNKTKLVLELRERSWTLRQEWIARQSNPISNSANEAWWRGWQYCFQEFQGILDEIVLELERL